MIYVCFFHRNDICLLLYGLSYIIILFRPFKVVMNAGQNHHDHGAGAICVILQWYSWQRSTQ